MSEENLKYVTIELSKKQVDTKNLYHSDKTNKDYARVLAPNDGTFFYPIKSIKVKQEDPNRVYFVRPEGTEIEINYSKRKKMFQILLRMRKNMNDIPAPGKLKI